MLAEKHTKIMTVIPSAVFRVPRSRTRRTESRDPDQVVMTMLPRTFSLCWNCSYRFLIGISQIFGCVPQHNLTSSIHFVKEHYHGLVFVAFWGPSTRPPRRGGSDFARDDNCGVLCWFPQSILLQFINCCPASNVKIPPSQGPGFNQEGFASCIVSRVFCS